MFKKIFSRIIGRKKIFALLFFLLIGGGFLTFKLVNGETVETNYYLAAVEKGNISTVISGSGQVYGQDQIALNPEVSGKVTQVYVSDNQVVDEGAIILTINSTSANQSVREAQAALKSAQLDLTELLSPTDDLTLLQAKNSLAQSERALAALQPTVDEIADAETAVEKAERDLSEIQVTNGQDVSSSVEDGYNAVVSAFLELPGVMNDLADLIGTENSSEEYIGFYDLLVGSSYSEKLLADYYSAEGYFNAAQVDYLNSNQSSDSEVKEQLSKDTLAVAKLISNSVNDANNLFDAIQSENYSHSAIVEHIDEMIPIISGDISDINSIISSLQTSTDTIERVNLSAPYDLADAEEVLKDAEDNLADLLAGADDDELASAEENVAEKKLQLANLEAGADESEIEAQKIVVAQKQNALTEAYENLEKYTIKAPVSGAVAGLTVKRGDSLTSGTTVATLVSNQKTAVISLNEVDVAKVKVDNKATLTFDALEDLTISGTVTSVDMIGSSSQNVVTYDVHIAFDTQDDRILPGMSVTADIVTEIKTDILMVNSNAIQSRDNIYYVQKFDQTFSDTEMISGVTSSVAPTAVDVEVGISNDTDTEIVSGLSEGNQVIIRTSTGSSGSNSSTKTTTSSAASLFSTGGGPSGGMPPQ